MNIWIARWGFAVLVGSGVLLALWVGWTVRVPPKIPGFALRAAPIYRLEVAAALFAGIYVAAIAFALALHNRGFSEIGTSGMKAQNLRGPTIRALEDSGATLDSAIAEAQAELGLDQPDEEGKISL